VPALQRTPQAARFRLALGRRYWLGGHAVPGAELAIVARCGDKITRKAAAAPRRTGRPAYPPRSVPAME